MGDIILAAWFETREDALLTMRVMQDFIPRDSTTSSLSRTVSGAFRSAAANTRVDKSS